MTKPASEPTVIVAVSASERERPPGLEPLEGRAQVVHVHSCAQLAEVFGQADILLVTDFHTPWVRQAWQRSERLRWVHATSAGVDALLFPALVESPVCLTNAAGIFDDSIAEYVIGVILAFAKDTLGSLALQEKRRWRHRETERVAGKQLLMIGAGGIGSAIGRRAQALDMKVVGVARHARSQPGFDRVAGQGAVEALLPEADYIALATPLTAETHHLLGPEEFALCKPGARLINVGRGALVDTAALVRALRKGQLAGAALDVFEEEPLPRRHPLWQLPNVMITPHMSGDVVGWREALSQQFIDNFERFVQGVPLRQQVEKRRYAALATQGGEP